MTSNNLSTVHQIYACFSKGDIAGILALLNDNVTFFNGADPQMTPFGGTWTGKNGVTQFFTALGTTTQTTQFITSDFRESGNQVINTVVHDGFVRSNNKPFHVLATFTWTFNDKGEVMSWKGTGDFSNLNAAVADSLTGSLA